MNTTKLHSDTETFCEFLAGLDKPIRARHIDMGWNDRYMRLLAEHSNGRIVATDEGYSLAEKMDEHSFAGWAFRYSAQIKKMQSRLIKTLNRRNRNRRTLALPNAEG